MKLTAPPTRARVLVSLLLLLLAWIPLAPLLTGDWFPFQHDFFMSDLLHAHLPYRALLHERLSAFQIPQWWPDIFSGVPYWSQIETGVLWPPNTIASFFLDAPASLSAVWLCNTLIAGVSGWYYARSLGARPLVASLAGVAWSLSGGMVSHLKHSNMQAAIALMPLMLATLENALNARRSFAWFSLATVASLFAGMPQITWVALLGCAVRAIHSWLQGGLRLQGGFWQRGGLHESKRRKDVAKQALRLGAATALAFVCAAIILWPTFRMNANASRQAGLSYEYAYRLASPPTELLSVFLPLWRHPYAVLTSFQWESWFYQGLVVTSCAVLGWKWTTRERRVAWELITVMCVALAIPGPLSRAAWGIIPGMNMFRFHERFFLLVSLMVLSFAIDGLELLLRRLPRVPWRSWVVPMLLVITVLDLSVSNQGHLHWEQWKFWTEPGPIQRIIPPDGQNGRFYHIDEYWRMMHLTEAGPSDDPATYRRIGAVPLGALGSLHHLWSAGGYANLVNQRVSSYFKQFASDSMPEYHQPTQWRDGRLTPAWHSMLDRANVGYILTEQSVETSSTPLLLDGETRVFRNETMLPRAYVARAWHAVDSNAQAADYMQGPGASDSRVPTIEGVPRDGAGERAPVQVPVEDVSPERVEVDLTAAPAGWLVLTDSQDAGWTATLDGEAVDIHYANGYQRAVSVEATSRRLVFQYETPGLVRGAMASAAGLLLLTAWLVVPGFRRRLSRS